MYVVYVRLYIRTCPLSIVLFSTEGEEEEDWLKQLGLETIVSRIKGELSVGAGLNGKGARG